MVAQLLDDPSPTAFVLALAAFSTTSLITHHLHENDRYQNHLLALGLAAVFTAVCLQPQLGRKNLLRDVFTHVPIGLVVASVLSSVGHAIGRARRSVVSCGDKNGHQKIVHEHDMDEKSEY